MSHDLPESGVGSKSSLDIETPPRFDKDVEAAQEKKDDVIASKINPRENFPTWRWVLSLLGLYLGALLYGTCFQNAEIDR
jgi:hypothetical protein